MTHDISDFERQLGQELRAAGYRRLQVLKRDLRDSQVKLALWSEARRESQFGLGLPQHAGHVVRRAAQI